MTSRVPDPMPRARRPWSPSSAPSTHGSPPGRFLPYVPPPRSRSVRILGPCPGQGPECGTVRSAYDGRSLSLAATARDPRWMGQPPPTADHRVPRGGEPRPQGAAEGAARPVDRRSAPSPRGEGPTTRAPGSATGGDHRDAGYDPALVPAADRPEVDVGVPPAGASRPHEGDRGAHRADGDRESSLGLQPHPGCVEEPRSPRREK